LACACALAACSSKGDSNSNNRSSGPSTTLGPGAAPTGNGTSNSTGGGNFGNSMGQGTSSNPNAMMLNPGPAMAVDPSAAPFTRDDTGMSGIDSGTIQKLKAGGGQCNVNVTFPYEGTMFPGGFDAPIIMFDGQADAVYVHFAYANAPIVDYSFAATGGPGEVHIPRDAWNEITRRTNNYDLQVTLNVLAGGSVGSCMLHWRIAPGNMIGALYYNTYQAPAPGVQGEGAVMRLTLGGMAEIYKQYTGQISMLNAQLGPCYSCHSVSFNGSTLVASFHDYEKKQFHVEKYNVTAMTQPTAAGMVNNANFGAVTPDGSKILAMGNPQCTSGADTFPRAANNFPLVEGPDVARLLDTSNGNDLQAPGLNKDFYMWMAQFSPDGDKVVFNHAKPDGNGGTDRRELAIMDFDAKTNAFSNLRVIYSANTVPGIAAPNASYNPAPVLGGQVPCGVNMCMASGIMNCTDLPPPGLPGDVGMLPSGSCSGPCYPAWPFFTPDGKAVVFSMVSEPDFAQAFPGRDTPSKSELWYTDLETQEAVRLDKANTGLKDIDKLNNYYPTVMPVAVGGYFWVFWTAVRDYGHRVAGRDPNNAAPDAVKEAIKKRIWLAAIKPKIPPKMGEVNAVPTNGPLQDPSYPGFYLDGQSESGNVRAFPALNPCMENGVACTSGLDCCCGYCLMADGQSQGACSCEPPKCAKINEKCTDAVPCCPPAKPGLPEPKCIGGFCNFLPVQ
jgi:hypothetical protein